MMFRIAAGNAAAAGDWACLRAELWPETSSEEHSREIAVFLNASSAAVAFLALGFGDSVVGFAEATLRQEYVNGCDTSRVAFLEGIYVRPVVRRSGVARALINAVESWAREQGMAELASDAIIGNDASLAVHVTSGFEETECVVYFRKLLHPIPQAH